MKIYQVGGAVRDQMLGIAPNDRDWLVTDAVPEDLLAKGYRQVGKAFPVFLHPETDEEYAFPRGLDRVQLRTMDSDAQVIHDLQRRDFTVNAMAMTGDHVLMDPCMGMRDLELRVIRHVSEDNLREDPIRLLRAVRLASRLEFSLDPELVEISNRLVEEGVLDTEGALDRLGEAGEVLGPRIYLELRKCLDEGDPVDIFSKLKTMGLLPKVFSALPSSWASDPLDWDVRMQSLSKAAEWGVGMEGMLTLWLRGANPGAVEKQSQEWRARSLLMQTFEADRRHPRPIDLQDHRALVVFVEESGLLKSASGAMSLLTLWEMDGFPLQEFWPLLERIRSVSAGPIFEQHPGDLEGFKKVLQEARIQAIGDEMLAMPTSTFST